MEILFCVNEYLRILVNKELNYQITPDAVSGPVDLHLQVVFQENTIHMSASVDYNSAFSAVQYVH